MNGVLKSKTFGLGALVCSFILLILAGTKPRFVFAEPSNPEKFTNNPLVAIADGEPVMMNDLKNPQIHDTMFRLYQMQNAALKEKALQILSKKHPGFLGDEIPEVTEEDIARFYQNTPGVKDLGTLEKTRNEIREYLERMFRGSYIENKYQEAVNKKLIKVFLKPPSEFRVEAEIGTAMLRFEANKKTARRVFILEYSDFQCPFCKRVQATLRELREIYFDKVQFGYRHFPLPFHKEAKDFAVAVECARDQGRFWQLQSIFFDMNGDALAASATPKILSKYALKAGVEDLPKFQKCINEQKYHSRVVKDLREGSRLGIQGTPTFILGIYDHESKTVSGEMFSGAVPKERFVEAIEKFLSLSRAEAKLVR